jgi:hypothetical protein
MRTMHAIRNSDDIPTMDDQSRVAERLVAVRLRSIADFVAPLRAEADLVREEIAALGEAARRKVWETIVQTREIHARICDAHARLEHLQLDIREQTGEVRLPSVPMPFVEFLLGEIRRFVVTAADPPPPETGR